MIFRNYLPLLMFSNVHLRETNTSYSILVLSIAVQLHKPSARLRSNMHKYLQTYMQSSVMQGVLELNIE